MEWTVKMAFLCIVICIYTLETGPEEFPTVAPKLDDLSLTTTPSRVAWTTKNHPKIKTANNWVKVWEESE